MTHGLVEPLQKEHERIVRLSLRLRSNLSGQCQGSQGDQSPADCRFSVDHGLVGERREIHDTPFGSNSPLRLEQGSYRSEKRGLDVAEARRWLPRRRCCATHPLRMQTYRVRNRCVKGSGNMTEGAGLGQGPGTSPDRRGD